MSQGPRTPLSVVAKEKLSKTARQLWQITRAFFKSERRGRARGLLTVLLVLSVAYVGITVLTSYAGRDLITAIERKDTHAYWGAMGWYLGTFIAAVLINVFFRASEQSLALLWREWMAQHLIKRYFNNRAYFRLRGPDSITRISESVRTCATSPSIPSATP